jgi:hypothetical protein
LRQNEIDIDKQTLSFHINAILDNHRDLYREVSAHGLNLDQVYREINMTNFGRIFAYLALVCMQSDSEESVREQVRISKAIRRTFKKGYLPNWTEEVFTITKRVLRRPPVYKIADFDDEELKGTFYEQELQRVNKTDSDFYRVEEILRSRMRNKRKEYFVKWLGYPDKFNSWVPAESVKDIK